MATWKKIDSSINGYFLESAKVKVFPCAYRDPLVDKSSKINTEYNLGKLGGNGTTSNTYIIEKSQTGTSGTIKCRINGYYFEITYDSLPEETYDLKYLYIYTKPTISTEADSAVLSKITKKSASTTREGIAVTTIEQLDEDGVFKGLLFSSQDIGASITTSAKLDLTADTFYLNYTQVESATPGRAISGHVTDTVSVGDTAVEVTTNHYLELSYEDKEGAPQMGVLIHKYSSEDNPTITSKLTAEELNINTVNAYKQLKAGFDPASEEPQIALDVTPETTHIKGQGLYINSDTMSATTNSLSLETDQASLTIGGSSGSISLGSSNSISLSSNSISLSTVNSMSLETHNTMTLDASKIKIGATASETETLFEGTTKIPTESTGALRLGIDSGSVGVKTDAKSNTNITLPSDNTDSTDKVHLQNNSKNSWVATTSEIGKSADANKIVRLDSTGALSGTIPSSKEAEYAKTAGEVTKTILGQNITDIFVAGSGTGKITTKVKNAAQADKADKATKDSDGNNIVDTYATQTALQRVIDGADLITVTRSAEKSAGTTLLVADSENDEIKKGYNLTFDANAGENFLSQDGTFKTIGTGRAVKSDSFNNNFESSSELNTATKFYIDRSLYEKKDLRKNDYAIVTKDEDHADQQTRYIWNPSLSGGSWQFDYAFTSHNQKIKIDDTGFNDTATVQLKSGDPGIAFELKSTSGDSPSATITTGAILANTKLKIPSHGSITGDFPGTYGTRNIKAALENSVLVVTIQSNGFPEDKRITNITFTLLNNNDTFTWFEYWTSSSSLQVQIKHLNTSIPVTPEYSLSLEEAETIITKNSNKIFTPGFYTVDLAVEWEQSSEVPRSLTITGFKKTPYQITPHLGDTYDRGKIVITDWDGNIGGKINAAKKADSASKLSVYDTGSPTIPIYFEDGIPKASSDNVGSANQPVYLNAGTITKCNIKALSDSIGSATSPIYIDRGIPKPCSGLSAVSLSAVKWDIQDSLGKTPFQKVFTRDFFNRTSLKWNEISGDDFVTSARIFVKSIYGNISPDNPAPVNIYIPNYSYIPEGESTSITVSWVGTLTVRASSSAENDVDYLFEFQANSTPEVNISGTVQVSIFRVTSSTTAIFISQYWPHWASSSSSMYSRLGFTVLESDPEGTQVVKYRHTWELDT